MLAPGGERPAPEEVDLADTSRSLSRDPSASTSGGSMSPDGRDIVILTGACLKCTTTGYATQQCKGWLDQVDFDLHCTRARINRVGVLIVAGVRYIRGVNETRNCHLKEPLL